MSEQVPVLLAVKESFWQKRTSLLLGLEDVAGQSLGLYHLSTCRVVNAGFFLEWGQLLNLPFTRLDVVQPPSTYTQVAMAIRWLLWPLMDWSFLVTRVWVTWHAARLNYASDLAVTGIPAEVPCITKSVMPSGTAIKL